jgi:hypothetical protein
MIDRATATEWLRTVAEEELDDELTASGFGRGGKTTVYSRKVPDGSQKIRLHLYVRPRYAPDSFHLTLDAAMAYPKLWQVRAEMLDHDPLLVGKNGAVHGEVLDTITPNPKMLLFKDEDGLRFVMPKVRKHLRAHILPYLDERNSVEILIARLEESLEGSQTAMLLESLGADPVTAIAGPWPVTVAAGQITLGQKDKARETLERYYPRGYRERIRYQRAFAVAEGE